MWRSATSSSRRRGRRPHARPSLLALGLICAAATGANAKVFLSVDEALALAFPGAAVERQTAYLTPAEIEAAAALAQVEVVSGIVHAYVARRDGAVVGTAYFDTHRVRTLPETLMTVIDPEGRVARIEVLSFQEPQDYLPRAVWYQQFLGHALDDELALKRAVRGVTGATLTTRVTLTAVRRLLALHAVIGRRQALAQEAAAAASQP